MGGVGIHLLISLVHLLCFKMGCGHNTNTRSELLALWALIYVPKELGISTLHVFGDSSAIINWVKGRAALSALNLDGWCHNIYELKSYFLSLYFLHVYREYNERADGLSKEVLSLATGHLFFTELYEGEIIGNGSIHLF